MSIWQRKFYVKERWQMRYNKSMKKGRLKKGFTIIEVILFLAISAAIFAAVMSNTSTTVARRRYNDSVASFVEELRNAYSATINVENYRAKTDDSSYFCSVTSGFLNGGLTINSPIDKAVTNPNADNYPGRTKCAVYGQVITFGEDSDKGSSDIHRYDLIGVALTENIIPDKTSDEVLYGLQHVGANIVTMTQIPSDVLNPTTCRASLAGTTGTYHPEWTGRIENRKTGDKANRDLYHGAILIARSPLSATVHTYFYTAHNDVTKDNPSDNSFDFYVQKWLNNTGTGSCSGFSAYKSKFAAVNKWRKDQDLDICVGSEDIFATGGKRRAIRIHGDGSTESAVELLSEVDSNLVCGVE